MADEQSDEICGDAKANAFEARDHAVIILLGSALKLECPKN